MDAQKAAPCVALLSEVLDIQYLAEAFRQTCPDIDLRLGADLGRLDDIDVGVCWFPPHRRLAQLPNLKLVQSLAAGIDQSPLPLRRDTPVTPLEPARAAASGCLPPLKK